MTASHQARDGTTVPSRDGWYYARCTCGRFRFGPVPDVETAVDVLMEHAFEMGERSERTSERAETDEFASCLKVLSYARKLEAYLWSGIGEGEEVSFAHAELRTALAAHDAEYQELDESDRLGEQFDPRVLDRGPEAEDQI